MSRRRRDRARRRAGSHPVRNVLGCGAVALGVWWLGWASPLTEVEHVVVSAPRSVSAPTIRLASGISVADHVPAVDAEQVRAAIMSALPAVADVRVSRRLPHTIRLEVRERTPLAVLDADTSFLVLDADGVVFDRVSRAGGLPVISAPTEQGRQVAREVLVSLPSDLGRRVREVTAQTRDDVAITLSDSAVVRWGSVEDVDLKTRVLRGLLPVEAARYDVSAPLLPTTSGRLG